MVVNKLMSADDAAEYLGGLARSTLATWRYKGEGPKFIKQGTRVLYDQADLDAWIDSCRRKSTSETKQAS